MPTLTIQIAGLPPVSHVLQDEIITIGRMKGNGIVIDDSSISLVHAKIIRKNSDFYLKDLNSTNGTLVNGQSLTEARLQDKDRVSFASVPAQFFLTDESAAAAKAGAGLAESAALTGPPAPAAPSNATRAPARAAAPVAQLALAGAPFSRGTPAPQANFAPLPKPAAKTERLISVAVAGLGGLTALAALIFIGWKFFHNQHPGSDRHLEPVPDFSLVANKAAPAATLGKAILPKTAADSSTGNPPTQPPPAEPGTQSLAQLLDSLKAPDPVERRRAASALHSLGPEAGEAVPALRNALKDTDPEVRMWTALTLINDKCYDKATIPILVSVLKQENPVLRQVACLSLGLIPYEGTEKESVLPALAEAVRRDTDQEVRKAATEALKLIAPESLAKAGEKN
ncbi:MAG TPA: HEAT repeat domain-containing protein [Candidatus Binatia bacterium]|nr:HEAT repeat domain-containing protein [Candidatus Binatia bacterium]